MRVVPAASLSPLSRAERQLRDRLVLKVHCAQLEAARALRTLNRGRLYRETHTSFASFALEHFNLSRQQAYKYIEFADTADELGVASTRHLGIEISHRLRPLELAERLEVAQIVLEDSLGLRETVVLLSERRAAAAARARSCPANAEDDLPSVLGGFYQLDDRTTLFCGDVQDTERVRETLGEQRFSVALTDPPQGLRIEGIANDDPGALDGLYAAFFEILPMDDGVVVACLSSGKNRSYRRWEDAAEAAGLIYEPPLYLHRPNRLGRPCRGHITTVDPIARYVRGNPAWPEPLATRHTLYEVTTREPELHAGHPTIKPVTFLQELLSGLPDGPVFDPFAGSGTTLRAARALGRQSFGIEINPAYCDLIRRSFRGASEL